MVVHVEMKLKYSDTLHRNIYFYVPDVCLHFCVSILEYKQKQFRISLLIYRSCDNFVWLVFSALWLIICPSSVINFSYCLLIFWHHWTDFEKIRQEKGIKVLNHGYVLRHNWSPKMTTLASNWPRQFCFLLYNVWTEIYATWEEINTGQPLPRSMAQQKILLWPLSGWGISDYSFARSFTTLAANPPRTLPNFVFCFGTVGKQRWPPWLYRLSHFLLVCNDIT